MWSSRLRDTFGRTSTKGWPRACTASVSACTVRSTASPSYQSPASISSDGTSDSPVMLRNVEFTVTLLSR